MRGSLGDLLEVPASRREPLEEIARRASEARRVVLTTHHNADADGLGSEAALAAWLEARGVAVTVVNSALPPPGLRFLLHRPDLVVDYEDARATRAIEDADLFLVLDTSEPRRISPLDERIDPATTYVIDHHPPGSAALGRGGLKDPSAAATGELIYDLISLARGDWPDGAALACYVALVSDTGSFRFSNTTPRAHAIAADLLGRGVDPEDVFQRLYAVAPLRRLALLREALARLDHDPDLGIAWIVLPREVAEHLGSTPDDFDGLIDHARTLEGTRVAFLLRETGPGESKVSLRSSGDIDVNRIARRFGGGGHVKASGATIPLGPEAAAEAVLAAIREALAGG